MNLLRVALWSFTLASALVAGPALADVAEDTTGLVGEIVPRPELRGMATEGTHSTPITVDVGHVQVESDLAALEVDGDERDISLLALTLKVGITPNAELGVSIEPLRMASRPMAPALQGVGESALHLKLNLLGNDGGKIAAAFSPWVGLPSVTAGLGRDAVEGGLCVPARFELPAEVSLTAGVGVALLRDDDGDLAPAIETSLGLERALVGELVGSVEVVSAKHHGHHLEHEASVGASLPLGDAIEVAASVCLGLNDPGQAAAVTASFAWRG